MSSETSDRTNPPTGDRSAARAAESDPASTTAGYRHADVGRVSLIALFVTALVTAQIISAKQLAQPIPFELPLVGALLVFPGGTLAYAATFFASDCISELYGKRFARTVVNVGFFMNFVMLALVTLTISWQPAPIPGMQEFSGQFAGVLSPATNIVIGSLLAYLVSQNWDVAVFHWIRERTGPDNLWLRNVGSTMTSQLLDTIIFTAVAFGIAPTLLGNADVYPLGAILSIIVGQYVAKLVIAVVDTPLVYAAVAAVRGVGEDTFEGTLAE